ncbi:hypothetical protein COBT_001470 [Conglomerata obtusa]
MFQEENRYESYITIDMTKLAEENKVLTATEIRERKSKRFIDGELNLDYEYLEICYKIEGNNPAMKPTKFITKALLKIIMLQCMTVRLSYVFFAGLLLVILNIYGLPLFLEMKSRDCMFKNYLSVLTAGLIGITLSIVGLVGSLKNFKKLYPDTNKQEYFIFVYMILKLVFISLQVFFNVLYVDGFDRIGCYGILISYVLLESVFIYEHRARILKLINFYVKLENVALFIAHAVFRGTLALTNMIEMPAMVKFLLVTMHVWNYLAEIKAEVKIRRITSCVVALYILGCCNYMTEYQFEIANVLLIIPHVYMYFAIKKGVGILKSPYSYFENEAWFKIYVF